MREQKHFGIRIDAELHYKLQFIADYEGRSVSSLTRNILRRYVATFERKRGAIPPPDEREKNT